MAINWLEVRHEEHGGVTTIPESAKHVYLARGWAPVEDEAPQPEQPPEPETSVARDESGRFRARTLDVEQDSRPGDEAADTDPSEDEEELNG